MPTDKVSEPLFDLFSYARALPGERLRLSPAEIAVITRIVRRTPEVMVKVLPQGAKNLSAVRRHLEYIGRKGAVELETDEGELLRDRGEQSELVKHWDLDLDELMPSLKLSATAGRPPPRLVHKLVFSMPPGTGPDKVLAATRNFMRENFALQHRYVMALHTDEPHPHVHVVLKARSEQHRRLNIKKETLREWREEFAQHMRAVGVGANATPRRFRGEYKPRKRDGIFRAEWRGESTHVRERAVAVTRQTASGKLQIQPGKAALVKTREEALRGWQVVSKALEDQGHRELAEKARLFGERMLPMLSESEWMERRVLGRSTDRSAIENLAR